MRMGLGRISTLTDPSPKRQAGAFMPWRHWSYKRFGMRVLNEPGLGLSQSHLFEHRYFNHLFAQLDNRLWIKYIEHQPLVPFIQNAQLSRPEGRNLNDPHLICNFDNFVTRRIKQ